MQKNTNEFPKHYPKTLKNNSFIFSPDGSKVYYGIHPYKSQYTSENTNPKLFKNYIFKKVLTAMFKEEVAACHWKTIGALCQLFAKNVQILWDEDNDNFKISFKKDPETNKTILDLQKIQQILKNINDLPLAEQLSNKETIGKICLEVLNFYNKIAENE